MFDVCVTANHRYNNINSQLDATITNCLLIITLNTFRAIRIPPRPCHQQAASSVHCITSCKHSLVLLRMGEIIARNMLS